MTMTMIQKTTGEGNSRNRKIMLSRLSIVNNSPLLTTISTTILTTRLTTILTIILTTILTTI